MRDTSGIILRAFVASVLMLVVTVSVRSQDATGRIVGNVTDPTGGAVPGAQVTVTNVGTKLVQTTSTDGIGYYQVLSLPIGLYDISIEAPGFRKEVFANQKLQINQSLRLDAKLGVGSITETIEVASQAANVETVNSTIASSVIGETIQRAPLNGRNVLDLAALQPGVTETNGDSSAEGNYSIAGGRSDSITYLLDGGLNNNLLTNGVVLNPNPDTIAEFRVLESNYSAEYGRNGGGIISVVTKSGTNNFHGSAFEFLRNDAFNANPYFNKASSPATPRPVLKRNQYGGTFGGPITLPHLVNGKDRFFFFVGYQGQRLSAQETSGINTVFTPAQLMGDFSTSGGAGANPNGPDPAVACFLSGLNHNALNPTNDPTLADGTPCKANGINVIASTYFQSDPTKAYNAIIDPTKFDAVAQNYISHGLIPTNPSGQAQYFGPHTDNSNEVTMKFDFVVTQVDKLSVTLGGSRNPTSRSFAFATAPGFTNDQHQNNYLGNLTYSHTFNPSLVNEFRLFVQRNNALREKPTGANTALTASALGVGITPDNPTGPPNILFDNGLALGYSEQGPTSLINNTFGFVENVSYVHGRHTWKFGGGISAYQNNTNYNFIVNGEFDFNGVGGSGSGNSLADFLMGIPSLLFQYPQAPSNIRSKSYFGFLQDDWRMTRKFTLNLGIRYEYNSPKEDTEGRTFSVIPGVTTPSTVFPNAPLGMLFPGDKGAPTGVNFPDTKNWAPRIGFAWDPKGDGKTSVRGGFGIFYDILKGEDNLQFNGQPPFFSSGFVGFPTVSGLTTSGTGYLEDPYSFTTPPVNPFPSKPPDHNLNFLGAGFLPINSGGSVYTVDPHLKTPYTYQYNLSVQRVMIPNTVLEVSYVGSSSHGLTSLRDIDPFVLGTTDRVLNLVSGNSTCQDSSGNSTSLPAGATPTCSYASIPEFKNVSKASYNSLQASLNRQITSSVIGRTYFTFAYTFAHSIDNVSGFQQRNFQVPSYQPNLFRASSDQDIQHRITLSGGWDLPFDRMWASGPKRLTQGWSLFPILTWHTGNPFDVFARLADRFNPGAEGPSGAGDPTVVHANIVGTVVPTLNPRTTQVFNGIPTPGSFWFNPADLSNAQCADPSCVPGPTMLPSNSQVVANPALATYGTLPRNFLRGPGYLNLDMAFSKSTAITEKVKIEFRAEFFNAFNHANFLNPSAINSYQGTFTSGGAGVNANSGQFGQILSTYDPRIIQLALRLSF